MYVGYSDYDIQERHRDHRVITKLLFMVTEIFHVRAYYMYAYTHYTYIISYASQRASRLPPPPRLLSPLVSSQSVNYTLRYAANERSYEYRCGGHVLGV